MGKEDNYIETHNKIIYDLKKQLDNVSKKMNDLKLKEEEKLKPEDLKKNKIEDLENIRADLKNVYSLLFETKQIDFNKHRVWRMFSQVLKDYDSLLLK